MGKQVKPKMENFFEPIIARIDELRGNRSVSGFARFLGMPQKSLDNYLKQGRKPSVELILLVCTKCHVSADWLLGLTSDRGGVKNLATNSPGSAVGDGAQVVHPATESAELQAVRRDLAALVQRVESLAGR